MKGKAKRSDHGRRDSFSVLRSDIVKCKKCPRLVKFREKIAAQKTKRYSDWNYWGRPVPGYGDEKAELVIIGLAPAAHGGNRTGRVFTGDLSAKFLIGCLYETGLTNQPNSDSLDDGLRMTGSYMLAAVRCVPPDNRPTPREAENCYPFLERELVLLIKAKSVLLLGKFAFDSYVKFLRATAGIKTNGLKFRHGAVYRLEGKPTIYASYHPSPRNTNTGKMNRDMFIKLLNDIKRELGRQ